MLHVAICDDEENEIEYLKYAVEDWAKKEDIITNIETYASAESFLFQYEECKKLSDFVIRCGNEWNVRNRFGKENTAESG